LATGRVWQWISFAAANNPDYRNLVAVVDDHWNESTVNALVGSFVSFNPDALVCWCPWGIDVVNDNGYLSFSQLLDCRSNTSTYPAADEVGFMGWMDRIAYHRPGKQTPYIYLGTCGAIDNDQYDKDQADVRTLKWKGYDLCEALTEIAKSIRPLCKHNNGFIIDTTGVRFADDIHYGIVTLADNAHVPAGIEPIPSVDYPNAVAVGPITAAVLTATYRTSDETGSGVGSGYATPRASLNAGFEFMVVPNTARDYSDTVTEVLYEHQFTSVLTNATASSSAGVFTLTSTPGENGIRAGDIVRYNYANNNTTYSSAVILNVTSAAFPVYTNTNRTHASEHIEVWRRDPLLGSFNANGSVFTLAKTSPRGLKLSTNSVLQVFPGDKVNYDFIYTDGPKLNPIMRPDGTHSSNGISIVVSCNNNQIWFDVPIAGMANKSNEKVTFDRVGRQELIRLLADGISVACGAYWSGLNGSPPNYTNNPTVIRQNAQWWKDQAALFPRNTQP